MDAPGDATAAEPDRLSTPAYTAGPSRDLPPMPDGLQEGALRDAPGERPPAYTPSPDPSGPQPLVAPMPLVTQPKRMADVKHPKVGPVHAIRYASHSSKFTFFTHVSEGSGLWSYVRCCRLDPPTPYSPPKEQGLNFAASPDCETCALVWPVNREMSENRGSADRARLLEVKLYQCLPTAGAQSFRKIKKIALGFSAALDPCDDACDRLYPYRPLAFSADGTILAVAIRSHRIVLCSVALAKAKTVLSVHSAEVTHIVFSREGNRMLSCSVDGIVRVTGSEAECVGKIDQFAWKQGARRATDVAISHDGKRVVCVWGSRVVIWWPETGTTSAYDLWQKRAADAEVWPLALSPCCKLLACRTEEGLDVLDSHTGDVLLKITQPTTVTAAAFSPNGDVLTLGREDGFVESWRIY